MVPLGSWRVDGFIGFNVAQPPRLGREGFTPTFRCLEAELNGEDHSRHEDGANSAGEDEYGKTRGVEHVHILLLGRHL